jgi:Na+/H+ antiporter NhaD/arsenite permease-like protein
MLGAMAGQIVAVLPFVAMLLAIALAPLVAPHWWDPNRNKLLVAILLGLPIALLYLWRDPAALVHVGEEYFAFIILLGGLYVVSGGIRLHGDLVASPLTNVVFLGTGAALASLAGTTGASMLLIRPLLQTNRERTHVQHTVIFFIFLVSNIGGLLTPLGDPPLFLGYLQGVPFTWTLRLWPPWLFMVVALLLLYFVWDRRQFATEPALARWLDRAYVEPLRIEGWFGVLALAAIVLSVVALPPPWREVAIVGVSGLSWWLTPRAVRVANGFTFHPILEVAAVFAGIFVTLVPALALLRAHGGTLGIHEPWHFFWSTGILSSFLDNAPTYLVFLAVAQGLGLPGEVVGVPHRILAAISLGAVCLGANTYIGNAPNFMVRSIAEKAGIPMPSFFGYLMWSGGILIPLFVLVTVLFV